MQRDRVLLAKVYFWQDQLVHLTSRVPPEEPDIELWPAIESPLAPPAGVVRVAHDSAADPAANDAVWRRLRRWQWIGSFAVASSAVLACTFTGSSSAAQPPCSVEAMPGALGLGGNEGLQAGRFEHADRIELNALPSRPMPFIAPLAVEV